VVVKGVGSTVVVVSVFTVSVSVVVAQTVSLTIDRAGVTVIVSGPSPVTVYPFSWRLWCLWCLTGNFLIGQIFGVTL
jgi:hypothetical protein